MEENKYYVYLHIKETTGEPFYVGKGINKRYKYGHNRSKHWHNIVNKHGFDIIFLETNLSNEQSLEREIYWIKRIGRNDLGLGPLVNFTNGGEGNSGRKHTDESKQKMSKIATGRVMSDKAKLNMSKAKLNMTQETKDKLSLLNKGKTLSQETKDKIALSNKGKKRSQESKDRMSKAQLGNTNGFSKNKEVVKMITKNQK